MRSLRAFARFWYDFVVGDDRRLAVGVLAALAAAFAAAHHGLNLWWGLPIAVTILLGVSVRTAATVVGRDRVPEQCPRPRGRRRTR